MQVTLQAPTISLNGGAEKPQSTKNYPVERRFEVVYLDEQLRITRYLPEEEGKETILFVQRRVPAEAPEPSEPEPKPTEASAELVLT